MIPIPGRATLLLAALLAACGDDCTVGDGGLGLGPDEGTIPGPSLMQGVFEGREASFDADDDTPWWRFDTRSGSFATDLAFHQNRSNADTLRGTFEGTVCHATAEIEWTFELRYPENAYPCSFSGKISGYFAYRIDGVIGCTFDPTSDVIRWRAIYLAVQQPG